MIEQGTLFRECSHPHPHAVSQKSGPHYAKLVCSDCGKFLRWLPSPETIKRKQENDLILTALSKLPNLPPWERQFVRDLVTHKHMSPKQQAKLLEVRDKFLGKGNADDRIDGLTLP